MMEEHLNPLAATHLLQHTLRSLCIHESSQWVYAVFWRILPRNYPPPKWDFQGGAFDRSRGNRRNWILVWEDGFCNFAASTDVDTGDCAGSSAYGSCEFQHIKGLQPDLFFKMSHEIYNFGEGLIGKVAADHSHKWVYKEANEQAINFLSAWHNQGDSHPRTWEAQFQCGVKTIALIAVREGVVQLGAVHKVMEDPSFVIQLRKQFAYLESIPGVLLPHPSSMAFNMPNPWGPLHTTMASPATEYCDQLGQPVKIITPSMSSLEALLAKLPSVVPSQSPSSSGYSEVSPQFISSQRPLEFLGLQKVAKEEIDDDCRQGTEMGENSNSMSQYYHIHNQHHHLNLSSGSNRPSKGF